MAIGAFTLSWAADVFGRRTSKIMCLAFMSVGMLSSAAAGQLEVLIVLRFLTGLGVGTMACCTGTLVFEYSKSGTAIWVSGS
jgi:MFS family permease